MPPSKRHRRYLANYRLLVALDARELLDAVGGRLTRAAMRRVSSRGGRCMAPFVQAEATKLLAVALLKIRECCSQAIFRTAYLVRHQPVGSSISETG